MKFRITLTEDEYEIVSSALNYRAGSMIVDAMRDPSVRKQVDAINELGFRLDTESEEVDE